jgi:predicted dehydrogenase
MSTISRRDFIAATSAGVTAAMLAQPSTSAIEKNIRHAVIGMGGRSRTHVRAFNSFKECDVVAVCDVDPAQMTGVPEGILKFADYRELLRDDSIDSISITTPDHWHTPIALAGLMAGKHVYVEKPCSHTVIEGLILEKAAQRFGKVVQHGTQGRSCPAYQAGVRFMHEGRLGKVRAAKAINHQLREPIGTAPEIEPPKGVNYDLWLGSAPQHAFTKNRWHYNWHWFWDYGAGDIANDGVHHIDLARWGLGKEYPLAVSASGGQFFYKDDHETPDTQIVTFEYDDCHLIYEMRLWTDYNLEGHNNGAVFYGDKGKLEMGRNGCTVTWADGKQENLGAGPDAKVHMRNYLDCVLDGNIDGVTAPIHEGSVSSAICHLGNIATRLNRKLHYDAANHRCTGDQVATKMLTKTYRRGYELPWNA